MLLRDIQKGDDTQVNAVLSVIATIQPDVLVLAGIDWDYDGRAITALQDALKASGHTMDHYFAGKTNRGRKTGLDLDGDGRLQEPEDAVGFGRFTGSDSLAVLSRLPILLDQVQDDTDVLWKDQPGALLPYPGQPEQLADIMPLSTTSHWIVPIRLDGPPLSIGTFFAASPVFDGPEDRNGRRNHDEVMYWVHQLNGAAPKGLIIAGQVNLDPDRGEGRREAVQALLDHPRTVDPHADQITVDWRRDDLENMRVSYVLPDTAWQVVDAGIHWPDDGTPEKEIADAASRHRLVWVDVIPAP